MIIFHSGQWWEKGAAASKVRLSIVETEDYSAYRTIIWLKEKAASGCVIAINPEMHITFDGTQGVLWGGLGKLTALLGCPVYALYRYGAYSRKPFWRERARNGKEETELKLLLNNEEVKALDGNGCQAAIKERFVYSEDAWRRSKKISWEKPAETDGMETILFLCPACRKEHTIAIRGRNIRCLSCRKEWKLGLFGEIYPQETDGRAESFATGAALLKECGIAAVPDWVDFEKRFLLRTILSGSFSDRLDVHVYLREKSGREQSLGIGQMLHTLAGFDLYVGEDKNPAIHKNAGQLVSLPFFTDKKTGQFSFLLRNKGVSYRLVPSSPSNAVRFVMGLEMMAEMTSY